jgi:hypothetical protein
MPWEYDPGEDPKKRHHWEKNEAGFVEIDGKPVGKCPNNISPAQARELLNDGVPWVPHRWRSRYPKRIYVVHDGVIYRAEPTNPGKSYHGFPELPVKFRELPRDIQDRILACARNKGCYEAAKRWADS